MGNRSTDTWRSEFDRLRKLGVKFNFRTLRALGLHVLEYSDNPLFSPNMLDRLSENPLHVMLNERFTQSFADRDRIVSRAHTGKKKLSPKKEELIAKEVVFHLDGVVRSFRDGSLEETNIKKADETHFVINIDNGCTLGFAGDTKVKYADFMSGVEGMTMVVRLSGDRDAEIEPQFLIFTNKNRSYPIRSVPDDVNGVSYRTGPKGWMDTTVMPEWFQESRFIQELLHGLRRILYVDNCSGHNSSIELTCAAEAIKTEVRYFPPNDMHLIQPFDLFIIQKSKSAWGRMWEQHKIEMIQQNKWSDSSGRIRNMEK